jgi:hypothetical protein
LALGAARRRHHVFSIFRSPAGLQPASVLPSGAPASAMGTPVVQLPLGLVVRVVPFRQGKRRSVGPGMAGPGRPHPGPGAPGPIESPRAVQCVERTHGTGARGPRGVGPPGLHSPRKGPC